jgi:hypothetical protein
MPRMDFDLASFDKNLRTMPIGLMMLLVEKLLNRTVTAFNRFDRTKCAEMYEILLVFHALRMRSAQEKKTLNNIIAPLEL